MQSGLTGFSFLVSGRLRLTIDGQGVATTYVAL